MTFAIKYTSIFSGGLVKRRKKSYFKSKYISQLQKFTLSYIQI